MSAAKREAEREIERLREIIENQVLYQDGDDPNKLSDMQEQAYDILIDGLKGWPKQKSQAELALLGVGVRLASRIMDDPAYASAWERLYTPDGIERDPASRKRKPREDREENPREGTSRTRRAPTEEQDPREGTSGTRRAPTEEQDEDVVDVDDDVSNTENEVFDDESLYSDESEEEHTQAHTGTHREEEGADDGEEEGEEEEEEGEEEGENEDEGRVPSDRERQLSIDIIRARRGDIAMNLIANTSEESGETRGNRGSAMVVGRPSRDQRQALHLGYVQRMSRPAINLVPFKTLRETLPDTVDANNAVTLIETMEGMGMTKNDIWFACFAAHSEWAKVSPNFTRGILRFVPGKFEEISAEDEAYATRMKDQGRQDLTETILAQDAHARQQEHAVNTLLRESTPDDDLSSLIAAHVQPDKVLQRLMMKTEHKVVVDINDQKKKGAALVAGLQIFYPEEGEVPKSVAQVVAQHIGDEYEFTHLDLAAYQEILAKFKDAPDQQQEHVKRQLYLQVQKEAGFLMFKEFVAARVVEYETEISGGVGSSRTGPKSMREERAHKRRQKMCLSLGLTSNLNESANVSLVRYVPASEKSTPGKKTHKDYNAYSDKDCWPDDGLDVRVPPYLRDGGLYLYYRYMQGTPDAPYCHDCGDQMVYQTMGFRMREDDFKAVLESDWIDRDLIFVEHEVVCQCKDHFNVPEKRCLSFTGVEYEDLIAIMKKVNKIKEPNVPQWRKDVIDKLYRDVLDSHAEHIEKVRNWLNQRIGWCDERIRKAVTPKDVEKRTGQKQGLEKIREKWNKHLRKTPNADFEHMREVSIAMYDKNPHYQPPLPGKVYLFFRDKYKSLNEKNQEQMKKMFGGNDRYFSKDMFVCKNENCNTLKKRKIPVRIHYDCIYEQEEENAYEQEEENAYMNMTPGTDEPVKILKHVSIELNTDDYKDRTNPKGALKEARRKPLEYDYTVLWADNTKTIEHRQNIEHLQIFRDYVKNTRLPVRMSHVIIHTKTRERFAKSLEIAIEEWVRKENAKHMAAMMSARVVQTRRLT